MVVPPQLMAAMPVGASMTWRLVVERENSFRKVVFPVPALPVRKRCLPVFSIIARARCNSGVIFFVREIKMEKLIVYF